MLDDCVQRDIRTCKVIEVLANPAKKARGDTSRLPIVAKVPSSTVAQP